MVRKKKNAIKRNISRKTIHLCLSLRLVHHNAGTDGNFWSQALGLAFFWTGKFLFLGHIRPIARIKSSRAIESVSVRPLPGAQVRGSPKGHSHRLPPRPLAPS